MDKSKVYHLSDIIPAAKNYFLSVSFYQDIHNQCYNLLRIAEKYNLTKVYWDGQNWVATGDINFKLILSSSTKYPTFLPFYNKFNLV